MTSSIPAPPGHYRADIDGLRALAVLTIILFHINPNWMPGGFIGVDVFFVISGYLISGILIRELQEGRFSLVNFYERRARRILPALWVLLLVCMPLFWFILLPRDAVPMGASALWSIFAAANFYFTRQVSTDYFAPQSSQMPFLHLWSLGVEEQFYIFWPLILLVFWHLSRSRALIWTSVTGLGLLVTSTWLADSLLSSGNTRFAYYMLPTRAGELALGAVLASLTLPRRLSGNKTANLVALAGWLLLGYSLLALNEHTTFPGWQALPPTLGAACLILAGQLSPASALLQPLSWHVTTWLGQRSYSAYLWHWPLLAGWRYLYGEPDLTESLLLLPGILLLAWVSHRWVETPARRVSGHPIRTLMLYVVLPMVLLLPLAHGISRGQIAGQPLYSQALQSSLAEQEKYTRPAHRIKWICQQDILNPHALVNPGCTAGADGQEARILLLGDSHAAMFAPLLRIAAEQQGVRLRSIAMGSCAPLPGSLSGVVASNRLDACEKGMQLILQQAQHYPLLIIGGAWATYSRNDPQVWQRLQTYLREATKRGQRVWLLPRLPEFADYDAACATKQVRLGGLLPCPAQLPQLDPDGEINAKLERLARQTPGVRFLPLHNQLCHGPHCPLTDENNHYLYADASHLSVYGSEYLASKLLKTGNLPDLTQP